jgi:sortase A
VLLDTPPVRSETRLQPVALRSRVEQRNHALSGYLLRTWVDRLLHRTELLLMIAALGLFGFWLADGPVRDWLHYRTQASTAPVAVAAPVAPAAATAQPPAPARPDPAPLPYTTVDMQSSAPESDFIAPRRDLPDARIAVAPQPTRLAIPAIGLETPVKEVFIIDGAWEVADYAAGYLHATGLPGEPGNSVLAGHAGLRGAVFRDLGALRPGDDIYIDAAGWRFQYRVRESKSVWPTQVEVLAPTTTPVLTLLTCTNWDTQRLVVLADLVASKPSPGS